MNSKETLCDLYLLALQNTKRRGKERKMQHLASNVKEDSIIMYT